MLSTIAQKGKEGVPIDGYFAQYDRNDTYGWVYLSKSGNTFAKLEGLDLSTGNLVWTLLNGGGKKYFNRVWMEDGKIFVDALLIEDENLSTLLSTIAQKGKEGVPIDGYFAQYDRNDTYGWVYLSKSGNTFAKLEGLDLSTGNLVWTLLNGGGKKYFNRVWMEDGKIFVDALLIEDENLFDSNDTFSSSSEENFSSSSENHFSSQHDTDTATSSEKSSVQNETKKCIPVYPGDCNQ